MFGAWFAVQKPDMAKAIEYDDQYHREVSSRDPSLAGSRESLGFCQRQCESDRWMMNQLLVGHILGFVACLFREVYETKIRAIGFLMRAFECLVLAIWYNVIFYTMFEITTWWLMGY
jgi:hypothetical protein